MPIDGNTTTTAKKAVIPSQGDLRDYFAAKVLQGLLANTNVINHNPNRGWSLANCTFDGLAHDCYGIADAMLRAREGKCKQ